MRLSSRIAPLFALALRREPLGELVRNSLPGAVSFGDEHFLGWNAPARRICEIAGALHRFARVSTPGAFTGALLPENPELTNAYRAEEWQGCRLWPRGSHADLLRFEPSWIGDAGGPHSPGVGRDAADGRGQRHSRENFASPFRRQRLERGPSNRDVIDMGGRLRL